MQEETNPKIIIYIQLKKRRQYLLPRAHSKIHDKVCKNVANFFYNNQFDILKLLIFTPFRSSKYVDRDIKSLTTF